MRSEFLVFGAPQIEAAEIDEVVATLESGWLGTGPRVGQFEADFATYVGVAPECVVAMNSCTAALHLSLLAADVAGGEVITTPMTFCATVNAIIHAGATPVLVDITPESLNLDIDALEDAITPATRAIVPVHFAGYPCDMPRILDLARRHDLAVIEDCAHAIETTIDASHAGTFGDFGCFSFYVTKNVVCGEGGMVVAADEKRAQWLRRMALHGLSLDASKRFGPSGYRHYEVVDCGFKYNMMDLQAAIGLHQLARVEHSLARREAIWAAYDDAFEGLPLTLPPKPTSSEGLRHARHLYTVRVQGEARERDAFIDALRMRNIGVGVHYVSLPEHKLYQERFGWHPDRWPVARDVGRSTVSLPLSPRLRDADVEAVVDAVKDFLRSDGDAMGYQGVASV